MGISVGLVNKTTHKTTLATNIQKSVMNIGSLVQINDSAVPGLGGRKAQTTTLVIQAQADTDYLLTDKSGQLPGKVKVSRAGSDLWIYTDPDKDEPDIIIKDYYLYKGDILAETTNGAMVMYQSESGVAADSLSSSSSAVLTQSDTTGNTISWESGIPEVDAGWLLLGALGIGGGVALANHSSGGDKGKSGSDDDKSPGKAPDVPKVELNNRHGLSGKGTEGSTVIILDDHGKQIATTKVDKNGNWSIATNPLKEGETGKIYAKGENGLESKHEDITGGNQTAPEQPVVTQNDEFTLAGTVTKGYSVLVTWRDDKGAHTEVATVNPDGTWFIKKPLPDGALIEIVSKEPVSGNLSDPISINVGQNAPPLGPTVEENGIALSGTGPAGSKIMILDAAGKLIASTMTDSSGKWHFADNPFAAGESGTIYVVNNAGRESAKQAITGGTAAPLPEPVITTNNSKGMSGKATPGSTITLKDAQGDVIGTTKTNDKGEWKFDKNPLVDGQKGTITASADGSADSHSKEFDSGDRIPPRDPVITENNSSHLSGTGEPGTGIIFKNAGNQIIGKARVDKDGNWSIEPNPYTAGSKGVMLGKDAAGNVTGDIAVESGIKLPPSSPEITENSGGKLAGLGEAESYILIKDKKGNLLQKVEVKADGTWVAEPNPFKTGETGTISSADKQGNEGDKITVTGGHSPAKAAVLTLEADTGVSDHDNITSNNRMTVKDMTEMKRWEYSTDGGKTWSKGSQTSFTIKDGTYDAHQVQVRYFDNDGNASQVAKYDKLVIDTLAPAAPGQTFNGGKIVLTGLENDASWEYSVDDGKSWLKGHGDSFTLNDGDYSRGTIQVKQTDPAGNISKISGNSDTISVSGKTLLSADDDNGHAFSSPADMDGLMIKALLMSEQHPQDEKGEQDPAADIVSLSVSQLLTSGPQHDDISTLLASFSSETPATRAENETSHDSMQLSYALQAECMAAPVADFTGVLTEQLPLY